MPTFRYRTPASLCALIPEQALKGGVRQWASTPHRETRNTPSNGHPECPGRLCPRPNIKTPERRWILEIHRPHQEHRLIWQIDFEPLCLIPSLAPSKLNRTPHSDTDSPGNADGAKERIALNRCGEEARTKTTSCLRRTLRPQSNSPVSDPRIAEAVLQRPTGPLIRTN